MFQVTNKKPMILKQKEHLFQKLYDSSVPKYIMGRNNYATQLLQAFSTQGIAVAGIIDDYTNEKKYKGFPVYKTVEIESTSLVIVCVLDARLVTALHSLESQNISHVLTYFDLVIYDAENFPQVKFCENNALDIQTNLQQYDWLYSKLDDELSRQTLLHITDFRYNFDAKVMGVFSCKLHDQYFDVFQFSEKEVFIDCGAYDGETTKQFITLNPNYKAVHVFEPSPKQYEVTKEALINYSNVHVYPYATYNQQMTTFFDNEKESASGLSNEGTITVETIQLDDIIKERVTYMKLDVEGTEYETLVGAEQLIKTYKPKLAVCVYHKQEDFWRIPQLLLRYNPNYRIVLRHYTEGILETVMYFI
ncbi:FkbM family methyltransferase [Bacillus fungorum]|uniref:Methyltransferase FkbM domain-containing protein n=1 Tax=Bacillus fungorum TaxID=2039284 RepID=A0A2G6QGM2_9BACI|nr:FkbM family methyltransferase [Bacillus fungorum]PIE95997.1 hypothetical protein CO726_08300 [Bacillus fungorum]